MERKSIVDPPNLATAQTGSWFLCSRDHRGRACERVCYVTSCDVCRFVRGWFDTFRGLLCVKRRTRGFDLYFIFEFETKFARRMQSHTLRILDERTILTRLVTFWIGYNKMSGKRVHVTCVCVAGPLTSILGDLGC